MKLDKTASLHTLPRRDRIVVSGLLLLVGALAWAFTVHQSIHMDEMDAAMWRDMNMSMNGMEPTWNAIDAVMMFVMWSAMMAAMMIPGSSPMITAFATINHRRRRRAAPDAFVLTEWRDGALGAAVMGLRHGLFCMGCCAALTLLLFAVAVMDLRWVVALTVLMTSEKILPGARVWRLAIAALLMASAIGFALAGWRSA
jgi:predicted metal-binding membrane protein